MSTNTIINLAEAVRVLAAALLECHGVLQANFADTMTVEGRRATGAMNVARTALATAEGMGRMTYCIQLSEGVRLSPARYLAALRLAMANPAASFKQSFNDPTGWMGGHTGASIVAEWRAMLRDRWAAWFTLPGKGNRARKRAETLRCCKWCGQQVGREFCDGECRRAYYN